MLYFLSRSSHALIISAFSLKPFKYCGDQKSHLIFIEAFVASAVLSAGDNTLWGHRKLGSYPSS